MCHISNSKNLKYYIFNDIIYFSITNMTQQLINYIIPGYFEYLKNLDDKNITEEISNDPHNFEIFVDKIQCTYFLYKMIIYVLEKKISSLSYPYNCIFHLDSKNCLALPEESGEYTSIHTIQEYNEWSSRNFNTQFEGFRIRGTKFTGFGELYIGIYHESFGEIYEEEVPYKLSNIYSWIIITRIIRRNFYWYSTLEMKITPTQLYRILKEGIKQEESLINILSLDILINILNIVFTSYCIIKNDNQVHLE